MTTSLRFAKSYADVEVAVTEKGNVSVFTPKGSLFIIRPKDKPVGEEAATKLCREVLASIAEHGMVSTMDTYGALVSPKMASVLEHHVEDWKGGREDGDKKSVHEDGIHDHQLKREKPATSAVGEEHVDNAVGHESKSMSDSALDDNSTDHANSPSGMEPASKEEHSDKREKREKAPKSTQEDVIKDHKVASTEKTAGEPPDFMKKKCEKCAKTECECKEEKEEKKAAEAPVEVAKYTSRLERLYRGRLDATKKEAAEKVASAERTALQKVEAKFVRALKLAAKRQALNLEPSPIKAAFHDALTTEADLDSESFYPGMDDSTAAYLIEAATSEGLDEFAEIVVKRATEFASMSDDAFDAIEADVKNLRPVPVTVQARAKVAAVSNATRQAALEGNLPVRHVASENQSVAEIVPTGNSRENIRSALGTTTVGKANQNFKK